MYTLSHRRGDIWVEHSHSPVYTEAKSSSGQSRIHAGVPGGDWLPFEKLVLAMQPPYVLLYILHTPRGEGNPGRYQSPELSATDLQSLIARFGTYLSSDARFDLWAYSPNERATVVWDRHNELYAYGPLARFSEELRALGFFSGSVNTPAPHQHHYRQELDVLAVEFLAALEWSHSPLRPEDEQFAVV